MKNNMIKRIVFIVVGGLGERDYKRYGIEILQNYKFKVEVWDLTNILYPDTPEENKDSKGCKYSEIRVFKDKKEVTYNLLSLTSRDFVINMLTYDPWSLMIYRILSKSIAGYAVCCANSVPVPEEIKNFNHMARRLFDMVSHGSYFILLKQIYLRFSKYYKKLIKPAAIALTGGKNSSISQYVINDKTELIKIHTFDYDLYLDEIKLPYKDKYVAVFLDSMFTMDPEMSMHNIKQRINSKEYFYLLNGFFDYIEKELNIEVIIAAHPRSFYDSLPDCFNGRKCIKGQTIKLIRESYLVMAHYSTAVNFANLFYKPIIFMSSTKMQNTRDGYFIKEMAKWHGKNPVEIDRLENINLKQEIYVNREAYKHYKESYIKDENTINEPFWEVVAKRLKTDFQSKEKYE